MRLATVGPGKMGRAVADLARREGDVVVAELGPGELVRDALRDAEVVIEFTEPDAAAKNLLTLARWGVPAVCGTTGWFDRLPEVRNAVDASGAALVYAPNFSLGVQLLRRLAREAARFLRGREAFDAYLLETHHRAKKDAPSGTASALRTLLTAEDPTREYPVTSIRAGSVPGTHSLHLDAPEESLVVEHAARNRAVFARGALVAARWLVTEPRRGVFTFEDVLFGAER